MPTTERFDRFIEDRARLGDLLEGQVAAAMCALAAWIDATAGETELGLPDPAALRNAAPALGQRTRQALSDLSFRALQAEPALITRIEGLRAALALPPEAPESLEQRLARAFARAAHPQVTQVESPPGGAEDALGPEVLACAVASALGEWLSDMPLALQARADAAWMPALAASLAEVAPKSLPSKPTPSPLSTDPLPTPTDTLPASNEPSAGLERAAAAVEGAVGAAQVLGEQSLAPERPETRFRQASALPAPDALAEDAVAFAHQQGVSPYSREARRSYFEALRLRMQTSGAAPAQKAALDLVAALFDYVVDDARMPPAAQPLLWRMQYPSVVLASLDAGYLGEDRRSIRRLVEHLAAISVAYADDVVKGSELYKRLETVVRAVEVVSGALHGRSMVLGDQVQKEYRRATRGITQIMARIEKERVALEATPGRRNRRDYSRRPGRDQERRVTQGIEQALQERLARHEVPESVRQFLLDVWARHLRTAVLRDGEGSASHRVALQVVDDLLWSLDASAPRPSRSQLAARIPPLIRLLTQGVSDIGAKSEELRPFFDELFLIHLRRMQRTPPAEAAVVPGETVRAESAPPAPAPAPSTSTATPSEAAPASNVSALPTPISSLRRASTPGRGIQRLDRIEEDEPFTETGSGQAEATAPLDWPVLPEWSTASTPAPEPLLQTPAEPEPQPQPESEPDSQAEPPGPSEPTRVVTSSTDTEGREPEPAAAPTEVEPEAEDEAALDEASPDDAHLMAQISDIDLSDFPTSPERPRLEVDEVLNALEPGSWLELRSAQGGGQQVKVAWINARRTVFLLVRRPDRRAVSLRVEDLRDRIVQRRALLVR